MSVARGRRASRGERRGTMWQWASIFNHFNSFIVCRLRVNALTTFNRLPDPDTDPHVWHRNRLAKQTKKRSEHTRLQHKQTTRQKTRNRRQKLRFAVPDFNAGNKGLTVGVPVSVCECLCVTQPTLNDSSSVCSAGWAGTDGWGGGWCIYKDISSVPADFVDKHERRQASKSATRPLPPLPLTLAMLHINEVCSREAFIKYPCMLLGGWRFFIVHCAMRRASSSSFSTSSCFVLPVRVASTSYLCVPPSVTHLHLANTHTHTHTELSVVCAKIVCPFVMNISSYLLAVFF